MKGIFKLDYTETIKTIKQNLEASNNDYVTTNSGDVTPLDLEQVSDAIAGSGWSVHAPDVLTYPGCFLINLEQQDRSVEKILSDWHDTLSDRTFTSARVVKTKSGQYVNPQKYKSTILAQSKHTGLGSITPKVGSGGGAKIKRSCASEEDMRTTFLAHPLLLSHFGEGGSTTLLGDPQGPPLLPLPIGGPSIIRLNDFCHLLRLLNYDYSLMNSVDFVNRLFVREIAPETLSELHDLLLDSGDQQRVDYQQIVSDYEYNDVNIVYKNKSDIQDIAVTKSPAEIKKILRFVGRGDSLLFNSNIAEHIGVESYNKFVERVVNNYVIYTHVENGDQQAYERNNYFPDRLRRAPGVDPIKYIKRFVGEEPALIGFDSEWKEILVESPDSRKDLTEDEKYVDDDGTTYYRERYLLSYQFYLEIDGVSVPVIYLTRYGMDCLIGQVDFDQKRGVYTKGHNLGDMLISVFKDILPGFGYPIIYTRDYHKIGYMECVDVTLVAHFGGVDLSACNDWKSIIRFIGLNEEDFDKLQELNERLESFDVYAEHAGLSDEEASKELKKIKKEISTLTQTAEGRHSNNLVSMRKHCLHTTNDRIFNVFNRQNNRRYMNQFKLTLRDSMNLSDGHASLAKLGADLGLEKLDTKVFDKEQGKEDDFYKMNMDEFIKDYPLKYMEYAARDSQVSHWWYKLFCGVTGDAVTTSSAAGSRVKESITSCGMHYDLDIRGYAVDNGVPDFTGEKTEELNVGRSKPKVVIKTFASLYMELFAKQYIGGNNMCLLPGVNSEHIVDVDIKSAYPNAVINMPMPDHTKPPRVLDVGHVFKPTDFEHPYQAGAGLVTFKPTAETEAMLADEKTVIPFIPAKIYGSAIADTPMYLLEHTCYANAVEIYHAITHGFEVTVVEDYYLPAIQKDIDGDIVYHPFGDALIGSIRDRALAKERFGNGSNVEMVMKLLCNGAYGKAGQGVNLTKERNILTDKMDEIGYSSVSDPLIASTITAIVRAQMCLVDYHAIECGYDVASTTTDGSAIFIPKNERKDFLKSVTQRVFDTHPCIEQHMKYVFGKGVPLFEVKGESDGFINITTRFGISCQKGGPYASGSYLGSQDYRKSDEFTKAKIQAKLYLERDGKVRDYMSSMRSLHDLKNSNTKALDRLDFKKSHKSLSFDIDYKRRIVEFVPCEFYADEMGLKCGPGYFKTQPHRNAKEALEYYEALEAIKAVGLNIRDGNDLNNLNLIIHNGLNNKFKKLLPHEIKQLNIYERHEYERDRVNYEIKVFLKELLIEHDHTNKVNLFIGQYVAKSDVVDILERMYIEPNKKNPEIKKLSLSTRWKSTMSEKGKGANADAKDMYGNDVDNSYRNRDMVTAAKVLKEFKKYL